MIVACVLCVGGYYAFMKYANPSLEVKAKVHEYLPPVSFGIILGMSLLSLVYQVFQ